MNAGTDLTGGWSEMETLQRCPLCGSVQHHREFPPDVRRCESCKVLFRSPRPTQQAIKESYDRGANYERWRTEEDTREAMWRKRIDLVRQFQPGHRLLDIGTGDGRFLLAAVKAGFEVDATELSDAGIRYAAERGFSVRKGQVTEIDFGNKRFDLITIWHVMEHVPNPLEVLMRCRDLLAPNGLVAIAVPNEDHLLYRHFLRKWLRCSPKKNPLGEIPYGGEVHLTHFQPATLKRFVRFVGFRILAFGVDDVFVHRDEKTLKSLRFHTWLARLTGWHASNAMYVIAQLKG
ncbi:MAG: class I SAM-dependent methyltransferase [Nibricoccus sp.]